MINTNSINTDRMNNKLIGIRVNDIDLKLFFMFSNSRVFVIANNGQEPVDVDISLNKTAFLSLFKGVSFEELIETDEIEINGSIKTAQQLADLMALSSIDMEELISQYTGDIIAHQLGKTLKAIKEKSVEGNLDIIESFKNELTTLLVAPGKSSIFKKRPLNEKFFSIPSHPKDSYKISPRLSYLIKLALKKLQALGISYAMALFSK